jgi:hypothetical protein
LGYEIVEIDPLAGEALPRRILPLTGSIRGMAFSRGGDLVVGANGALYVVDVNTGTTHILSNPGMSFLSLATNPLTGEFWGIPFDPSSRAKLYKINPVTGDTAFKGITGLSLPTVSLAFDHTGNLFGLVSNGVDPGMLVRIDTATGAGTMVGSLGIANVLSMTFSPDTIMSSIKNPVSEVTSHFVLMQNYPNPFNPTTAIRYGLPNRSYVTLTVVNTLGQQVAVLEDGQREAGYHEVKFDGSGLSSGVYFYRIQAGSFVQTRKLLLIR